MQCHTGYEMSLAVVRKNGVRSVVGYDLCKSQHRGESMPVRVSDCQSNDLMTVCHTLIAEYKALAISLSCSSRGLLPKISGSQN